MTTYNGEKYLLEQLVSIENQDYRDWHLYVSDDGSTDSTLSILKKFASKNPQRVSIFNTSDNLGFVKNFLSLVSHPKISAQYYALADQDDIWCVNKLSRSVRALQASSQTVSLYCGRSKLIDSTGHFCGYSPLFKKKTNFSNSLVQSIGGGNTMSFNHATRTLIATASQNVQSLPSHDWWFYILISGHGGQIIYDIEPTILYRQHDANLVGTNMGVRANLNRIVRLNDGHFRQWCAENILALKGASEVLTDQNIKLFQEFVAIRHAPLHQRISFILTNKVFRQTSLGNFALKLAIIFQKI
jgi:glycosyltransferase involved in cell wall biosynthesis